MKDLFQIAATPKGRTLHFFRMDARYPMRALCGLKRIPQEVHNYGVDSPYYPYFRFCKRCWERRTNGKS